jgi:hypothetical protein
MRHLSQISVPNGDIAVNIYFKIGENNSAIGPGRQYPKKLSQKIAGLVKGNVLYAMLAEYAATIIICNRELLCYIAADINAGTPVVINVKIILVTVWAAAHIQNQARLFKVHKTSAVSDSERIEIHH